MRMSKVGLSLTVLAAGCGALDGGTERRAVTEPNQVGVVALEFERFDDHGDVFELRGLDDANQERAAVRLRVGVIEDLTHKLNGTTDVGSELVLSIDGHEQRYVSRELALHHVGQVEEPRMEGFLQLREVTSALRQEANILVDAAPSEGERAYWYTYDCPPSYLNVTPFTQQCCSTNAFQGETQFINPNGDTVNKQGPQTPCTTYTGGSCAGSACYWGPNGFARPSVTRTGLNVVEDYGRCASGDGEREFSDTGGEYPNGQGCPGGNTGDGEWDY